MVKLFLKISNLWSRYLNITDGLTTCSGNTELCVASHGKAIQLSDPRVVYISFRSKLILQMKRILNKNAQKPNDTMIDMLFQNHPWLTVKKKISDKNTNQKRSIHASICFQQLMKSITYRSEVRPKQHSNVSLSLHTVQ